MADEGTQPPRPVYHSGLTHGSNPTRHIGFLALAVSGGIMVFLTGLTVTVGVVGVVLFSPLIILSSPLWVPLGALLFVTVAAFVSLFGFGLVVASGLSWTYKYARGQHPLGSDRVDYARSRIAGTASQVRDYAKGYAGKGKDAAPSA